ncbi:hypothetical protein CEXT_339421 [Caerostris extrusa]|uniref:Uncharacterized protein n=1 Tax=Caerostris extrusa TaxID=172846 RepID=A0AAV4TM53_CAEEX|nr:hypothetical protein CEXT_339421 [Caerostris extrusa]
MVSGQRVVTRLPSPLEVKRERRNWFRRKAPGRCQRENFAPGHIFPFEEKKSEVFALGKSGLITKWAITYIANANTANRDKAFALEWEKKTITSFNSKIIRGL